MDSKLRGKQRYYFEHFKDKEGNPPGKGKKIEMSECKHKSARVIDGVLRCKCGACWTGPRIGEVEKLLKML